MVIPSEMNWVIICCDKMKLIKETYYRDTTQCYNYFLLSFSSVNPSNTAT